MERKSPFTEMNLMQGYVQMLAKMYAAGFTLATLPTNAAYIKVMQTAMQKRS
jgi:hypothetical protein